MKVAVGCDHAGFIYKDQVIDYLKMKGYEVEDCGTYSDESVDYPVFSKKVCESILNGSSTFGVVICGSGEGVSMVANRFKGIRCGIAYNDDVAKLMRQHNNANVIAFGSRFMNIEEILKRLGFFLETEFEGGRHEKRISQF